MGLSFLAQNLGAIYSATITAVGATSGALSGVFLLGVFFPCVNAPVIGDLSCRETRIYCPFLECF